MGFKELGHSHRPLVVPPKVPDGAVDGGVRQQEHSFLFHPLEKVNIVVRFFGNMIDRYNRSPRCLVYLKIDHQHLSL